MSASPLRCNLVGGAGAGFLRQPVAGIRRTKQPQGIRSDLGRGARELSRSFSAFLLSPNRSETKGVPVSRASFRHEPSFTCPRQAAEQCGVLPPLPLALPALLLLSALWLIFWHAAVQDLYLVTLPLIILAALLASFGWAGVQVLWFPVCFILFAMPFWTDLVGILRPLSVRAVDALIWLTGLPAYMDGNAVRLPAGVLVIADGCSGVHFFMVGLAMAALFGELSRVSVRLRVIWLALMGALAVIAQWIRIFVIAVVAYATDMRSPLIADHYWLGWV